MTFLLRRALHGLLLIAGVSVLSFALLQMAPGNFFDEMRLNPQISVATISHLRTQYGLDRPLPVRYARWLASAAQGDFGYSFAYNMPVAPLVLVRASNTLLLGTIATMLAWVIAFLLGTWSALRRGSWTERVVGGATAALVSLPDILIALALLVLAVRSHLVPLGGMSSVGMENAGWWRRVFDGLQHLALPVIALTLSLLPMLVRHVRSAVSETLQAPFVRAARAHGISRRRILWCYVLRAALNPLISLFGVSIATLLSASLIVEIVTSWPGLGPLMLEAILARDVYVVIGIILISSLLLLAGNLLADALLLAADPRIRKR